MDKEKTYERYFNLTLRFLSYRPRSEKEVYDYLKKKTHSAKSLDEEIIARIMQRLTALKFLDDVEFAKQWVANRSKSRKILKIELTQKGVSKEIIEKVISSSNLEEKEDMLIKKLIEKKMRSLGSIDDKKAYEKIASYLLRKGFKYDQVKKHLRENIEF